MAYRQAFQSLHRPLGAGIAIAFYHAYGEITYTIGASVRAVISKSLTAGPSSERLHDVPARRLDPWPARWNQLLGLWGRLVPALPRCGPLGNPQVRPAQRLGPGSLPDGWEHLYPVSLGYRDQAPGRGLLPCLRLDVFHQLRPYLHSSDVQDQSSEESEED